MKLSENGIVCNEFNENAKYKSFAWRTPTYNEMNYIINQRSNASNFNGLGRVLVNGTYINGCFILPDNFIVSSDIAFTPTTANYTTNSYTLEQFRKLEYLGCIFLPICGYRSGNNLMLYTTHSMYYLSNGFYFNSRVSSGIAITSVSGDFCNGFGVRLVRNSSQGKFSTPTGNIDFATANLQYHCTKHIWRFAQNQYDFIGQANANISDTYNGWIDLFGYGTSGVNYSPTLHTTNNSDYASGDISRTENDWGVNIIHENSYFDKNIKIYNNSTIVANNIDENI